MTKLNNTIDDARDQLWIIKQLIYKNDTAQLPKEVQLLNNLMFDMSNEIAAYLTKQSEKDKRKKK